MRHVLLGVSFAIGGAILCHGTTDNSPSDTKSTVSWSPFSSPRSGTSGRSWREEKGEESVLFGQSRWTIFYTGLNSERTQGTNGHTTQLDGRETVPRRKDTPRGGRQWEGVGLHEKSSVKEDPWLGSETPSTVVRYHSQSEGVSHRIV